MPVSGYRTFDQRPHNANQPAPRPPPPPPPPPPAAAADKPRDFTGMTGAQLITEGLKDLPSSTSGPASTHEQTAGMAHGAQLIAEGLKDTKSAREQQQQGG